MKRTLLLTIMALTLGATDASAANIGQECKVGPSVPPQYLCPIGTTCLQGIGKMYCSNAGKVCGWPGASGYNLGTQKQYQGREYECTVTGFKRSTGEECSSGSSCATGLCLTAISKKYCSNLGKVCGWRDSSGYTLGQTQSWQGKDYTCTTGGFEEVVPLPQIRQLTSAERSVISKVFGRSVNSSQIRVTDTIGASNRPWTSNTPPLYTVNVGDAYDSLAANYKGLLVHEVTHVWQGQHGVPFMSNSAVHQTLSAIQNGGDTGQAYTFVAGKQWSKYNVEQQASIVEDWYRSGMSQSSELYPYIRDNVLRGQPTAQTRFK